MIKHCKKCNKPIVVPEWAPDEHKQTSQLICYACARALEKRGPRRSIVDRLLDRLEAKAKKRG